jgi:TatD DNase family protein
MAADEDMVLVDSHCHIDFPELAEDTAGVLQRMAENRVLHALCVSVCMRDFPRVLELATRHSQLFASAGVHPDTADEESALADLLRAGRAAKVVAIGETGLDYFRASGDLEWQRQRFRTHIRAARELGKPLIIHCRDAAEDLLRILREERAREVGGVMHCFTQSWDVAAAAMDLGFMISFSGIVTFKSAGALREVAAQVPSERLLVETDSPYLAPVPHRGKTNEPAFVRHVAEALAQIRATPFADIAAVTTANFFRMFNASSA